MYRKRAHVNVNCGKQTQDRVLWWAVVVMLMNFQISKDNIFPVVDMKPYKGSRHITPLILNLSTRWR
jgi:hypothetical protein